jgi:hypothetical protein
MSEKAFEGYLPLGSPPETSTSVILAISCLKEPVVSQFVLNQSVFALLCCIPIDPFMSFCEYLPVINSEWLK